MRDFAAADLLLQQPVSRDDFSACPATCIQRKKKKREEEVSGRKKRKSNSNPDKRGEGRHETVMLIHTVSVKVLAPE